MLYVLAAHALVNLLHGRGQAVRAFRRLMTAAV
jgi:hypothetical protein